MVAFMVCLFTFFRCEVIALVDVSILNLLVLKIEFSATNLETISRKAVLTALSALSPSSGTSKSLIFTSNSAVARSASSFAVWSAFFNSVMSVSRFGIVESAIMLAVVSCSSSKASTLDVMESLIDAATPLAAIKALWLTKVCFCAEASCSFARCAPAAAADVLISSASSSLDCSEA